MRVLNAICSFYIPTLIFVVLTVAGANAASGDLDPAFNGTGIATVPFLEARAIAVQPDNKIVVAGINANVSIRDFAVARFNADGTPDSSFDGDGRTTTSIFMDDRAYAVAVQSDGRIVVAGWCENGVNYDFCAARYNSDGSLDTSFDGDGKMSAPIGAANDFAYALAIQPDGKILIAGTTFSSLAILRLNSDGSPDTSFDGDGRATVSIGSSPEAHAVRVQPDGKIVVAGFAIVGSTFDFAVARLNADGSLDTAFDSDGIVTTAITNQEQAYDLVIQNDGRIVVAGQTIVALSTADFALVRYNTDGSLDTTFGTGGKVITTVSSTADTATSLGLDSNGKLIAGGFSAVPVTGNDFVAVRYNADGSLDSSFAPSRSLWGTGGISLIARAGSDSAYGMALDSLKRPVMAGSIGGTMGIMRLQNSIATAAAATLGGRVVTKDGRGIANAIVTLNGTNGAMRTTKTGSFGYFSFDNLPSGEFYLVTVSAKRFVFATDTLSHQLFEDFTELEFIGAAR